MRDDRCGAVVLAAGAGRRLGGVAKALLRDGGASFLERVITTAGGAGVAPVDVVVVVGPPFAAAVSAEARRLGATVSFNPTPERGMASSVALGFAAHAADVAITMALLWPVDHPRVALATLTALRAHGEGVPAYRGRGGHPPLVPRRLFGALAGCADAVGGARDVLGALDRIAVDDAAVVTDVDDAGDLERMCSPG